MLNKTSLSGIFFMICFLLMSCSNSFERIRESGDPDLMLSAANKYFDEGKWLNAQMLYEEIISAFRGKEKAEDIYFKYSQTYFELNQFLLSSYYFKRFVNTYPNSRLREDAEYMTAYSEYKRSPKYRLDQNSTDVAMESFQNFINSYPHSPRVEECNRLMDELREKKEQKAFEAAKLYFDTRNYQSAAHCFKNFVRDYPNSGQLESARYFIVKADYLLAFNSIPSKQFERYEQTIEDYESYKSKYGDSGQLSELEEYYVLSKEKIKDLENE